MEKNDQINKSLKVAVSGAAGQIAYNLLFRIAAGNMFGPKQPVILHLLDLSSAMKAVHGVMMELSDSAFPLLAGLEASDDPRSVFQDVDIALLLGAKPRGPGMLRKDLLKENGPIFTSQGKALNEVASRNVKICVVGNPANTNCYIAMNQAPDLPKEAFSALVRLDQNRAISQLATKLNTSVDQIKNITIWGNHSLTQYPDIFHAEVGGQPIASNIDMQWVENNLIPTVQQRGKAIIDARGTSSAASAASAVIDHMKEWIQGTSSNTWTSMAVASDGSYGIDRGLIFGFPVTCSDGRCSIVQGLSINEFSKARIDITTDELRQEAREVANIL